MAIRPTHLRLAARAARAVSNPLAEIIQPAMPAYCAGALAPDGHGNRAVPRARTHFYDFPDPTTWGLATRRLFQAVPDLAQPDRLPPAQVAYVAGYLTHLAVDEVFAARLGSHAVDGDGPAIRGLVWAIEDGWEIPDPDLTRADAALAEFSMDGLTTIVRTDHLAAFMEETTSTAGFSDLGDLRYRLHRQMGRDVSRAEAQAEAASSAARGRALFGSDIRTAFADQAQREIESRLVAYAAGEVARYDAPSLRPSAPRT